MVEATIEAQKHRLFQNELGPILTATHVQLGAAPAVEEVATF